MALLFQQCCSTLIPVGGDIQINITRRAEPLIGVVARGRPSFDQNGFDACQAKQGEGFFDLILL
jgi:hypothetical protein